MASASCFRANASRAILSTKSTKQYQDDEWAFRASGKERRYAWDYDPEMDIFAYSEKTGALKRLTTAKGYDAEGGYSHDGQWIAFSSMRDAYNRQLSDAEKKQLEVDPSPNAGHCAPCPSKSHAIVHAQSERRRTPPVSSTYSNRNRSSGSLGSRLTHLGTARGSVWSSSR